MEDTKHIRMVSVATNTGFATVFALALLDQAPLASLSADTFTKVYFILTIAAAVISFFLLAMMLYKFRHPLGAADEQRYEYYYLKKSESFTIFGLFFSLISAVIFALVLKRYSISPTILMTSFFLGILYLSIGRYYRHVARRGTRSFTSMGSTFIFLQLLGVAFLLDQTITHLFASSCYKTNIAFSLLGVALFFAVALIIKDIVGCKWARPNYSHKIGKDIPKNIFPYEMSPILRRQIINKEHSPENVLFFDRANAFYKAYIKNNGNLTVELKKDLNDIYQELIVPPEKLLALKTEIINCYQHLVVQNPNRIKKENQEHQLRQLKERIKTIYKESVKPPNNEEKGDQTSILKEKIKQIYEMVVKEDSVEEEKSETVPLESDKLKSLREAFARLYREMKPSYEINISFHLREKSRAVSKKINEIEDNETKKAVMKNFSKVYSAIYRLNEDAYRRYTCAIQSYLTYTLLLLPGISLSVGGLTGFGIQQINVVQEAMGNEWCIIVSAIAFWLVGYGIGEMILHRDNKCSNQCKAYMESITNKLGCA